MKKGMWVAMVAAPLVLVLTGGARAQDQGTGEPRVLKVEARPENGRTLIRLETTSGTINYTSFTRNRTTVVVDVYGVAAGNIPSEIPVNSAEVRSVHFEYSPEANGTPSSARFLIERTGAGASKVRQEGETLVVDLGSASASATAPQANRWQARRSEQRQRGAESAPDGPAHGITEIFTRSDDARLAVSIRGDGKLRYDSFTLDNPPRLVVDIHGVENQVAQSQVSVGHATVSRIRIGQFRGEPDKVARVVFDLVSPQAHRLIDRGSSLEIGFGGDEALALLEPAEGPEATDVEPVVEAAQGAPPSMPGTAQGSIVDDSGVQGGVEEEEGTLMSLDLKDADIKDVLRYFSEISGLNIILDPAVSGSVTVRLIDVPWNKALDIILKSHGYGKTLDGNVLRIASIDKLTTEEAAEAALQKARQEARPLVTMTRPVSYGEAQQIASVIERTALSSKGSIIIDQRTNTLVITEVDLPEYRQRILDLIKTLDTPTPQVEIEARIVETTRTFARSFGIQYGFSHTFDTTTGSTTGLTFPSTGALRGDMINPSSGFDVSGRGYAVNLPAPGANGAIGFHLANINDQFQLDMALSALEDEGQGRILSSPKITTQSNISASIQSGASIPVQTVANNTITTQYIPFNLLLQVTPQVTADGTVILKVNVTNNQPDFGTRVGFTGLPPVNQRQANTTVMVADGGTAVIGGVFQLNESETQNRLPMVHKIPILGWLFKNKNISRSNNELLIFITPKIKRLTGSSGNPGHLALAPGVGVN